jgi:hypothetical protein
MYALRERRQHVTQEDFEFAVAKVCCFAFLFTDIYFLHFDVGAQEEPGRQYLGQQAVLLNVVTVL